MLDLPTPAALVDRVAVERNCRRMAERATALGVRLRPHVKTHKCVEGARLQVAGHFGGITVSTLAEARFFADHGFRDITYAVPIAPARAAEAVALAERLGRLHVLVDSKEAVGALEQAATAPLSVLLKVDCGYHRAGVDPEDPASVALARRIANAEQLDFAGVLTHAGHSYHARNREEIAAVARQERDVTVAFAERLRAEGIEVRDVSIGSTPTMAVADDLTGVTEIRPGNYVFFDDFQVGIGSCEPEDRAFFVLATVIGCHPGRGQLVINAGALALSKDQGAVHVPGSAGGYGSLASAREGRPLDRLQLVSLSQEHGVVRSAPGANPDLSRFPVGSRLRVYPNHSCLAAACFERYSVFEGQRIEEVWEPCRGW